MDFQEFHTFCKEFGVLKSGKINMVQLESVFHNVIQDTEYEEVWHACPQCPHSAS